MMIVRLTIRHKAQRAHLPIAAFREEIVRTVRDNQVMILSGETGWYVFSMAQNADKFS